MARPKRSEGASDAPEKLLDAFWELLEDHTLGEVSIGMITARAGYNRGTFYYHFADKDALVSAAIENELQDVPGCIFALMAGAEDIDLSALVGENARRMALLMDKAGSSAVEKKIKDYLIGMWTMLLTPEGGVLKDEVLVILVYAESGLLGLLSYLGSQGVQSLDGIPLDLVRGCLQLVLKRISEIQGVSLDEIAKRLSMLTQLTRVNQLAK